MAIIIDGQKIADDIIQNIKQKITNLKLKPGLAAIIIGNNPSSQTYVNRKQKIGEIAGFYIKKCEFPESVGFEEIKNCLEILNQDSEIHGIIIQMPLPPHLNPNDIFSLISDEKDVEGFKSSNYGQLLSAKTVEDYQGFYPCTPLAVIKLIESTGVSISGKKAVVVGRSNIVGKPTAMLLLQKDATVEICHSRTEDLEKETVTADILVVAVGKPDLITAEMVKKDAIVIDVGINRIPDQSEKGYHLSGDVDFSGVSQKASYITPVPGGVGPMTIAILLQNTLKAAKT